ncbi:uncharacterized protein B4U79_12194, partial [Dinothrombium tinctorium]
CNALVYFPLFELIQFKNEECVTSDNLTGTCYTLTECALYGGVPRGICAAGFCVCCFWNVTCGGTAVRNRTYFINPHYPLPIMQEIRCAVTILKPLSMAKSIYELRINFRIFQMSQPTFGHCSIDAFSVVDYIERIPVICGNNDGLHSKFKRNEYSNEE